MQRALKGAAAVFAAAFITLSAPQAAEPLIDEKSFPGEFSANVGLYSEYYFRGVSQTDDAPALQGGLDWSATVDEGTGIGVYLGVWGSNVDFNEAAGVAIFNVDRSSTIAELRFRRGAGRAVL